MLWYEKGDISPLLDIKPEEIICFDTETTGFQAYGDDEILQLSIVRGDGVVLFSDYLKPTHRQRWPKSQEIHGITPSMVKDKPTILDRADEIKAAFADAKLLVAYNLEFDYNFLVAALGDIFPSNCLQFDVMKEYAPVAGVWSDYKGDYKWQKLSHCAHNYGFRFQAHNALEDTKATLHCFHELLRDDKYLGQVRIHAELKRRREDLHKQQKAAVQPALQSAKTTGEITTGKGCLIAVAIIGLLWICVGMTGC